MPPTLRDYARQTNIRLIGGGLFILFFVGLGLIWWRYGSNAALLGLLCLLAGLTPLALIALSIWILDLISKHANRK
mgnify:FL=1